jgi:hypothetical protein
MAKFIKTALLKQKERMEPQEEQLVLYLPNFEEEQSERRLISKDTETEKKAEGKSEGKRKRKTKDEKETEYKQISSSLTADMLQDAIKTIDKEIKDYEKERKDNMLEKEGSSDLNKKMSKYGLKFKAGTKVATVLDRLEKHKTRLENEHDIGNLASRFSDLKTSQEKAKKAETIDI